MALLRLQPVAHLGEREVGLLARLLLGEQLAAQVVERAGRLAVRRQLRARRLELLAQLGGLALRRLERLAVARLALRRRVPRLGQLVGRLLELGVVRVRRRLGLGVGLLALLRELRLVLLRLPLPGAQLGPHLLHHRLRLGRGALGVGLLLPRRLLRRLGVGQPRVRRLELVLHRAQLIAQRVGGAALLARLGRRRRHLVRRRPLRLGARLRVRGGVGGGALLLPPHQLRVLERALQPLRLGALRRRLARRRLAPRQRLLQRHPRLLRLRRRLLRLPQPRARLLGRRLGARGARARVGARLLLLGERGRRLAQLRLELAHALLERHLARARLLLAAPRHLELL